VDEEFSQLNTVKALSAANVAALALIGFSGAFGIYLLHELIDHHQNLLSVSLNVAAALFLFGVRFVYWPLAKNPRLAHLSWKPFVLAGIALVLALAARAPQFHV